MFDIYVDIAELMFYTGHCQEQLNTKDPSSNAGDTARIGLSTYTQINAEGQKI